MTSVARHLLVTTSEGHLPWPWGTAPQRLAGGPLSSLPARLCPSLAPPSLGLRNAPVLTFLPRMMDMLTLVRGLYGKLDIWLVFNAMNSRSRSGTSSPRLAQGPEEGLELWGSSDNTLGKSEVGLPRRGCDVDGILGGATQPMAACEGGDLGLDISDDGGYPHRGASRRVQTVHSASARIL